MKSLLLFLVAGTLALASVAQASVLWRGDFSTGNLSQWTGEEWVNPDRLMVVPDPEGSGRDVLRVRVQQGDDPVHSGQDRNELFWEGDHPHEGDVRYYRWQTLFPSDFQPADWWQIFTQWHQYSPNGSPPLAFMVWGNKIELGSGPRIYWSAPLVTGHWHDFVLHVRWSSDPNVGGVEIWYDGHHVLPFTHGATLFPGDSIYLKQGLYRKNIITQDQTIYDTGMTVGTSLADVSVDSAPPQGVAKSLSTPATTSGNGASSGKSLGVPDVRLANGQVGCDSTGVEGLALVIPLILLVMRRRRRA